MIKLLSYCIASKKYIDRQTEVSAKGFEVRKGHKQYYSCIRSHFKLMMKRSIAIQIIIHAMITSIKTLCIAQYIPAVTVTRYTIHKKFYFDLLKD